MVCSVQTPNANARAQTAVRVAAPFVTAAVTWAGPRVLGAAYRAGTGRRAPSITSARYSTLSKVAWAMAVAGLVALTEAMIFKTIREIDIEVTQALATSDAQEQIAPSAG